MNAALTTCSTVDSLIDAYRAHVVGQVLPTPCSVRFNIDDRRISVQPGGDIDLCSRLRALLRWADTLTDLTAWWWHTRDHSLHVTVTGRTGSGTRLEVYAGGPFADTHGLVSLDLDQRAAVSLEELHALSGLLREDQREREAA